MEHVKGPDFPGGGLMSMEGIRDAYASGRASVKIRARAHVEPLRGGKDAIIVSELPFQVKKGGDGGLITKIADLVRDKKITGISDLRDESDRSGMRLVIELKRGGDPAAVVLNQLYKHTPMQASFGVNMVALVDNVPKTLSLKELIRHYVAHQREVVEPPHPVRAPQGRGARPRARGNPHRARQPRRGDRPDPRLRRPRRRARGPDRASSGSPRCRRRRSSTCACSASPRSSPTRSAPSTPSSWRRSPSCARSSATPAASTP